MIDPAPGAATASTTTPSLAAPHTTPTVPPPSADAAAPRSRNPIRRIYDWVLGWADTPYGVPALFVLAFIESSMFPIPPDVLLIALALSAPTRAFRFAA